MPPSPISPTLKSRVVEVDSLNPEDLRRFASAPLSGRFSKGVMWMTASPEVHRLLFMTAGQGLRKWLLNHLPGTVEYRRERVELKGLMDAEVLTLEEIPQQAGAVHASSSTSSAEPQRQRSHSWTAGKRIGEAENPGPPHWTPRQRGGFGRGLARGRAGVSSREWTDVVAGDWKGRKAGASRQGLTSPPCPLRHRTWGYPVTKPNTRDAIWSRPGTIGGTSVNSMYSPRPAGPSRLPCYDSSVGRNPRVSRNARFPECYPSCTCTCHWNGKSLDASHGRTRACWFGVSCKYKYCPFWHPPAQQPQLQPAAQTSPPPPPPSWRKPPPPQEGWHRQSRGPSLFRAPFMASTSQEVSSSFSFRNRWSPLQQQNPQPRVWRKGRRGDSTDEPRPPSAGAKPVQQAPTELYTFSISISG